MRLRRLRKHHETVYKSAFQAFFVLCMRYSASREDAEEAFNDGMFKYFGYEKENNVREATRYALIKKILLNTCIDRTRKRKLEYESVDPSHLNQADPGDPLRDQELREELLLHIQQLPPTTQLVFNLYLFEGWSHQQIAEELKISPTTSSWHLGEGKKRVYAQIKPAQQNARQ